ncbi:hypothetical protein [Agrobacterium vitis]|uniref:hypothetical protein n=1 Tax=Agrobacterium vitis TaxID=373 RepID=UPI0015DB68A4|nr:hypothetical protein [Agrobacterium vitis]
MTWKKKYLWRRTWPDQPNSADDYVGYDGEEYIGRIYLDMQTPFLRLLPCSTSFNAIQPLTQIQQKIARSINVALRLLQLIHLALKISTPIFSILPNSLMLRPLPDAIKKAGRSLFRPFV